MKKIYCILLTALLYAGVANAQNDFSLNEQLFSRIAINPAGTGNSANVNIFTLGRFQYAGMEGSPYTVLLNAHGYIENASSGVGLSVSYDKSGIAYHQVQAKAVYAYHLNFGRHNILSFGVGLGIMNKQFDPSRHRFPDPSSLDPEYSKYQNKTVFDASFGVEYANPYILLGVSVNHIPGYFMEKTTLNTAPAYYAYARGMIKCSDFFSIAPAAAYYYTGQFHVADVSATGFLGKYVYVGLGYKTETTAYFMVGFDWKWLRIGYAFDANFGKLSNVAWTSHEIMLSFNISTKKGDDNKWIY